METEGDLDETYISRSTESKENSRSPIDTSTTYFKLFNVSNKCAMYEVGEKHFPGYKPEDGYGYYRKCDGDLTIPPQKKVILMDKVCMELSSVPIALIQKLLCLQLFKIGFTKIHCIQFSIGANY